MNVIEKKLVGIIEGFNFTNVEFDGIQKDAKDMKMYHFYAVADTDYEIRVDFVGNGKVEVYDRMFDEKHYVHTGTVKWSMNASELYQHEKETNENIVDDMEDTCDYCNTPVIVTSMNGHDIFLEDWKKSLACVDCCDKYDLVKFWSMDYHETNGKYRKAIEKLVNDLVEGNV